MRTTIQPPEGLGDLIAKIETEDGRLVYWTRLHRSGESPIMLQSESGGFDSWSSKDPEHMPVRARGSPVEQRAIACPTCGGFPFFGSATVMSGPVPFNAGCCGFRVPVMPNREAALRAWNALVLSEYPMPETLT